MSSDESSEENPYENLELGIKAIENSEAFIRLNEHKNTISDKCIKLPVLILKSSCFLIVLGLLVTWLIFTLVSARSSMYSKKWDGETLLEYNCYNIKQSCNSTISCDKYNTCQQDIADFKQAWLKETELSYGDKIVNTFDGASMYNSEGGTIFSSMVVYVFMTISLFLCLMVIFYKIFF